MHFEHLKITVFLDFESTHELQQNKSLGAQTGARDAEERRVSRARQAEWPRFDDTASSVVCPGQADATASGGGGGGGDGGSGGGGGTTVQHAPV